MTLPTCPLCCAPWASASCCCYFWNSCISLLFNMTFCNCICKGDSESRRVVGRQRVSGTLGPLPLTEVSMHICAGALEIECTPSRRTQAAPIG